MKRNITGYVLLAIFALVMSYAFNSIVIAKPLRISELDSQIKFEQEKLISAQILASELKSVSSLIEENLVGSTRDGLTEEASLDFLNSLIGRLNSLGCEITDMKTYPHDKEQKEYIRTPYEVSFKGTFNQFGRLLNELEKDSRLVTMEYFKIDNNLTQLNFAKTFDDLKLHMFTVKMSTLTLVRSDQDMDTPAKKADGEVKAAHAGSEGAEPTKEGGK